MYVIKVGDFYVKVVDVEFGGFVSNIVLSKEIMRNFTKDGAERIAKMVNGEVVCMDNMKTKYEQLSLFDEV